MSEYGRCNDCGATGGSHFNDCDYDGTDNRGIYHHSSGISDGAFIVIGIILSLIFPPFAFLFLFILMHM